MQLFPTTIATGDAFCNRVAERQLLKQYIKHGNHVVVTAPRRYGKTSLINQVLLEIKRPYCIMELTMATSIQDLERIMLKHTGDLLYSLLPRTLKAKQNILKLFKWLNPELILTAGGQKLVFHPGQSEQIASENIAEMLIKLDAAARLAEKNIIVVIDEFQQLNEIEDHTIEASIRHAMQYSTRINYIFSGSNRHMLLSMFNDKNRPFYNACEMMSINRITSADYEPFIQNAAQKQWKKPLAADVLEEIFRISELHPSYINRLCGYFWLTDEFPTKAQIEKFWRHFVASKHAEFTEDMLRLSKNQRKVFNYLAHHPVLEVSSHEVGSAIGLSEASIRQAVNTLLQKDYLYKDEDGVTRVLDPALRDFIKNLI